MRGCLVLICGLPGAGKSTLAASMIKALKDEGSVASKELSERLGQRVKGQLVSFDDVQDLVAEELRAEELRAEELRAEELRAGKRQAEKLRAEELRANELTAKELTDKELRAEGLRAEGLKAEGCSVGELRAGRCEELRSEKLKAEGADGLGADGLSTSSLVLRAWKESRMKAQQQVVEALRTGGQLVLIDDNLYYRSMRYIFCQIAREFRVGIISIKVECDIGDALSRNAQRHSQRRVPDEVIRRMSQRFESFDAWETHNHVMRSNEEAPWSKIASAWLDPRLEIEEAEKAAQTAAIDRQKNAENFLHNADIVLRKAVASFMQRSGVVELTKSEVQAISKKCAKHRKDLLQELRACLHKQKGENLMEEALALWADSTAPEEEAEERLRQEFEYRMSL